MSIFSAFRSNKLSALSAILMLLAAGCSPAETPSAPAASTTVACATCQAFITATPLPTSTETPAPPATETPVPTPLPPLAPFYKIHECLSFTTGLPWNNPWRNNPAPVYSMWCVLNIKIGPTGTVMLDVYWSARTAGPIMYVNVPPEAPAIIYMIDNLGNKYESTKRGGCALTAATVHSGQGCSGWLTYAPFAPGATSVSVFYDAHGLAIRDISLVGNSIPGS